MRDGSGTGGTLYPPTTTAHFLPSCLATPFPWQGIKQTHSAIERRDIEAIIILLKTTHIMKMWSDDARTLRADVKLRDSVRN